MIETHRRTGQSIGALVKAHGVHRSWLCKRRTRYRAEGKAGLERRSTRPKSSFHRFEADFLNECWQADMTQVVVVDDQVFEVLNIIDDHSRLCVASWAFVTVTSPDVVRTLHAAAGTWGDP